VAFNDQVVQVPALLSGQAAELEVIHDEKVRCQEAAEHLLEGVVDACLGEGLE